MKTALPLIALAAAALASAGAALAADPAVERVDAFNRAVLDTMKQGKSLGAQGRFRKLQPAVEQAFDLPTMTRVAVGPTWTSIAPADQQKLVAAFSRFSAATWAHNFDDFDGEQFKLGGVSSNATGDKLVKDQLVSKAETVNLGYRMRQAGGGGWKIVDVFFNGVSSLAAQRSDFASALSSGGAPALLKKLDAQTDTLLKGK